MDENLKLYRLVPIARADDPNWLGAKSNGEVLVAARTTGDARIAAAEHGLDFMDINAAPAGDKTTKIASVFRNEKLYTIIEIANGNTVTSVVSSAVRSASTRSFPRKFDAPRRLGEGTLPKCRCLLLAVTLAASISSTFAFAQQDPDGDRCKADRSEQQSQNPQQAPVPGDNSSGKLSDCEGVLKPPAVGDTELEKPAPEVGKTPVIRPGDTPKGQQNNQQPSK